MFKRNKNQTNICRLPSASGEFYPSQPEELETSIEEMLSAAEKVETSVPPHILILPHAGYIYSGKVAAYGFKAIENSHFERVVLIGRSHHHFFEEITVDDHDCWGTPLGNVALDKAFIKKLAKASPIIKIDPESHFEEDSLEVQLPFLIKILGKEQTSNGIISGFQIAPLLFGDGDSDTPLELADALGNIIDEKTLVIASSDLSHYPKYDQANQIDQKTIEAILTGDFQIFQKTLNEIRRDNPTIVSLACAELAIVSVMALAKRLNLKPKLLKYANSGDTDPENKVRVVGYASIGFFPE